MRNADATLPTALRSVLRHAAVACRLPLEFATIHFAWGAGFLRSDKRAGAKRFGTPGRGCHAASA